MLCFLDLMDILSFMVKVAYKVEDSGKVCALNLKDETINELVNCAR